MALVAGGLLVLTYYVTMASYVSTVALFLFFAIVSLGNTLGGVLTSRATKLLGQVSYSCYLLHGLMLVCYTGVLHAAGFPVKDMTVPQYWLAIVPAIALVIVISSVTYRFVEAPFLKNVRIRAAP